MAVALGTLSFMVWKSLKPEIINCPECRCYTASSATHLLRIALLLVIPLPIGYTKAYHCEECGSFLTKGES